MQLTSISGTFRHWSPFNLINYHLGTQTINTNVPNNSSFSGTFSFENYYIFPIKLLFKNNTRKHGLMNFYSDLKNS